MKKILSEINQKAMRESKEHPETTVHVLYKQNSQVICTGDKDIRKDSILSGYQTVSVFRNGKSIYENQ